MLSKEKPSDKSWEQVVKFHQGTLNKIQEQVDKAADSGEYMLPIDSKNDAEVKIICAYFGEKGYNCGREYDSGCGSSISFSNKSKRIKWLGKHIEHSYDYGRYRKEEEKKGPTEESKTWELVKLFYKDNIKVLKDAISSEASKGRFGMFMRYDDREVATIMSRIFQEDGYRVKTEIHWFPFLWDYVELRIEWLGTNKS